MVGLIVSILVFNFIAFSKNKRLSGSEIVQIWTFTIAFQQSYDFLLEFKFHAYWYFQKDLDILGLIGHICLIPPVNMMFLNWYPFKKHLPRQFGYLFFFVLAILVYEALVLLPPPWGYFHLGWWKIWYDAFMDPLLLVILLLFYKWVYWLHYKTKPGT